MKHIEYDPLLAPFEGELLRRLENYHDKRTQLLGGGYSLSDSLSDFANGHLYYGFHQTDDGWIYREWAPNAVKMYLTGDFNGWNRQSHPMWSIGNGSFEIFLPGKDSLPHASQVKVHIHTRDEAFDRIPLYIRRAVQLPNLSFNGEIWNPPEPFWWTDAGFSASQNLFIYECHAFTEVVLPRISRAGYNAVQLMAIAEHPYYGSFGYQVSNFFAVSSRFGTPDDLKRLINTAHSMGIAVFLDLVHSHSARNIEEGIGRFDGTEHQFFHSGERGNHPAWGTKLFNYGKLEVIHFLLSNIKFWIEEYHFDGFRFDGITSMIYNDYGTEPFTDYRQYFSENIDADAVTYLQLATQLCKEVKPDCVLIAEDMSGMPGMCVPIEDGGIGFDYRLGMGAPDYWIKTLRDRRDEDWDLGQLWHELTQRRPQEKVIGYCESHDQALVGDKTIMFWLADSEMYWNMRKDSQSHIIDRAMALHKMIRLITCALAGEGYLNFMGNEFGHPEWIDFPRDGNGHSYHYARRQWSLAEDDNLRYQFLLKFDTAMIALMKNENLLRHTPELILNDETAKVLIFRKGAYTFAFNFHTSNQYALDNGENHKIILHSDWDVFGGTVKICNHVRDLTLMPRTAVVIF